MLCHACECVVPRLSLSMCVGCSAFVHPYVCTRMKYLLLLIVGTNGSSNVDLVKNALVGGIQDFIRRGPESIPGATPMYSRKTQAPLVWVHLHKAPRIVVDNEYYNLSLIPGMNETNLTRVLTAGPGKIKLPEIQAMFPHSFIETKVDPLMIQNGLYLAMPLRNPPQETMNIIAAEDTRSIQSIADTLRKKRETIRLQKAFNAMIREIALGG